MINEPIDAARHDPDAAEELPSAWQMDLAALAAWNGRYMARLMDHDPLTAAEDRHWGEIVGCIEIHNDARRHTWFR